MPESESIISSTGLRTWSHNPTVLMAAAYTERSSAHKLCIWSHPRSHHKIFLHKLTHPEAAYSLPLDHYTECFEALEVLASATRDFRLTFASWESLPSGVNMGLSRFHPVSSSNLSTVVRFEYYPVAHEGWVSGKFNKFCAYISKD